MDDPGNPREVHDRRGKRALRQPLRARLHDHRQLLRRVLGRWFGEGATPSTPVWDKKVSRPPHGFVEGMDVETAIRSRRTHKAFGPQPLRREEILALLELARWAPNHHLT